MTPTSQESDPPALAHAAARAIAEGFDRYLDRFRVLTREARTHFERSAGAAVHRNPKRRLDLYGACIAQSLDAMGAILGSRASDRTTWRAVRDAFDRQPIAPSERDLAETYFNSIVRRVFHTVGVDPLAEFVRPGASPRRYGPPWSFTHRHDATAGTAGALRRAFQASALRLPWEDIHGDADRAAAAIERHLKNVPIDAIEMVREPFFRGKGAYLIGLIHAGDASYPLLLALRNPEGRIRVDAALLREEELSVIFSFAHAYFFVEVDRPKEMIDFLSVLLPQKPIPDLWTSIGFHRHGKTELYRWLVQHLQTTDGRFHVARGQRGMVMIVFALEGFEVVFKVIRDRFPPPKSVTREEVRDKYRLVFRHDRAGRLVDAQEFEHLVFPTERFEPGLLEELVSEASETVTVWDGQVTFRHLYTERQLIPLDVYLREAPPDLARAAVLDYGQVMRDLADTNIFPGDMLLKNFGVSRHGRVIFYDYDELCLLTDCRFRDLPAATTSEEEVSSEPWYFVGEHDIFPEEFSAFLGLRGDLRECFLAAHGELLTPDFWRRAQDVHRRGIVPDIFPYPAHRRLHSEDGGRDTT